MTTTTTSARRTPATAVAAGNAGTAQRAYPRRGYRVAFGHEPGALPRRRTTTVVAGRIPFVTVIMGLLGCGLALTLLLTTRAAEDSYQLSDARAVNQQLINERARLQREVESADSAPSLAAAAGKLGMVPTRDPAHLVVGPDGTVVVIGKPKPAAGLPAPLLNLMLPPVSPNATTPGRVYPDSTVLSSGAASGADPRVSGEQLVQVPVGSLVAPGAQAAALPAPVAAGAQPSTPGGPASGAVAPGMPAAAAAVPAGPAVPAEGGPAAPAPAVSGQLPAPIPAPPTGGGH